MQFATFSNHNQFLFYPIKPCVYTFSVSVAVSIYLLSYSYNNFEFTLKLKMDLQLIERYSYENKKNNPIKCDTH